MIVIDLKDYVNSPQDLETQVGSEVLRIEYIKEVEQQPRWLVVICPKGKSAYPAWSDRFTDKLKLKRDKK